MLKVGLTGGIASGKSVVGEMFVALGAKLIQADQIAHELMQPGQAVYNEMVRCFGSGILNAAGSVNRARLAEVAFGQSGESSRVEELNRIVHPVVIRREDEWMGELGRRDPHAIAIVEAALILEAGASDRFDRLLDVIVHGPILAAAANVMDEISQDFLALRRVGHFRMKLQREYFLRTILKGGIFGILGYSD